MKIKAAIYSVVIIATFLLTSNMVQGQGKDYTFCLGSISVTLKDGGPAIMNRYSIDGQLILSLGGEWTAYGSPNDMPGQTIRIKYNGSSELFRYDLIRDGFGNPSVLIDGNGRNYKLCNTSSSSQNTQLIKKTPDLTEEERMRFKEEDKKWNELQASHPIAPMSKFIGFYLSKDGSCEMEIKEIPYTPLQNENIKWGQNEKKVSLSFKVTNYGKRFCDGVINYKVQNLLDWKTTLGFTYIKDGRSILYKVALQYYFPSLEVYSTDEKGENVYQLGIFEKVDETTFIDKINRDRFHENLNEEILTSVSQMPVFAGGHAALIKHLQDEVQYFVKPSIKGMLSVKFCVTKEGYTRNFSILKGIDQFIDYNIETEIKNLPKFKPGMNEGVPVNVWYEVHVPFNMNDSEKVNWEILNSKEVEAKQEELDILFKARSSFTDSRDGKIYKTIKLGNQTWMAQNLSYKANKGCFAYNNDTSNVSIYGYLYDWETAMDICPEDWHLPSEDEWNALSVFAGGDDVSSAKLMERGGKHWSGSQLSTDLYGFKALPGGKYFEKRKRVYINNIRQYSISQEFYNLKKVGYWWSSTNNGNMAIDLVLDDGEYFDLNHILKTSGISVRCVKNDIEYEILHPEKKVDLKEEPEKNESIQPEVYEKNYPNGQLAYREYTIDGKKNGTVEEYYKGGRLKSKWIYKDDLLVDGTWISYYENGDVFKKKVVKDGIELEYEVFYENGKLNGRIIRLNDGTGKMSIEYYKKNGKLDKKLSGVFVE